MTFMTKVNRKMNGPTSEEQAVEVTKDCFLTGVNPRRLKEYLDQRVLFIFLNIF